LPSSAFGERENPHAAALWAIALTVAASMLDLLPHILADIIQGLEDGARSALGVIIACATAGIIIGVVTKPDWDLNWVRY
jgi:TRAP-type uncharacterized transport system fused permease subunit